MVIKLKLTYIYDSDHASEQSLIGYFNVHISPFLWPFRLVLFGAKFDSGPAHGLNFLLHDLRIHIEIEWILLLNLFHLLNSHSLWDVIVLVHLWSLA